MYATGNPKTKKELKERVARAGRWYCARCGTLSDGPKGGPDGSLIRPPCSREEAPGILCLGTVRYGAPVSVYSPGPFPAPTDGKVTIEGPHFPAPHRWYATATVSGGNIVPGSVR